MDSVGLKNSRISFLQTSEHTRMMNKHMSFLLMLMPSVSVIAVHHSSSISLGGHAFGCKLKFCVQAAIFLHSHFVNLQYLKRCRLVSA